MVLDDELISSKASDVENKLVTGHKSGGGEPCCDVLCDSFFQFMLEIRIHMIVDSQIDNMEKLLDNLPPVDNNESSHGGPIIACDRGYGKKKVIERFAKRNFKVNTIANALGSEHPIIASSKLDAYREKIHLYNIAHTDRNNESSAEYIDKVLESNLKEFDLGVAEFALSDKETLLLGPEVIVCQHTSMPPSFAHAYHDIYDKKVAQKILRFTLLFCMGFLDLKNYSGI